MRKFSRENTNTPSAGYRFRYLVKTMGPFPYVQGIENDTFLFVMWDFFYTFVKQISRIMTEEEFFKKENPVGWLFEKFPELNAGQVAKAMGINETLFRNYINGTKRPSASRIMDIENFLQKLGKELSDTRLL